MQFALQVAFAVLMFFRPFRKLKKILLNGYHLFVSVCFICDYKCVMGINSSNYKTLRTFWESSGKAGGVEENGWFMLEVILCLAGAVFP